MDKLKAIRAARWLLVAIVVVEIIFLGNLIISIDGSFDSIDQNLSAIETQLAPGGGIDTSLSSIETMVAPGSPLDNYASTRQAQTTPDP